MARERKLAPNAYDEQGLLREIAIQAAYFREQPGQFYDTQIVDPAICQGDIVRLHALIPIIDEEGDAATHRQGDFWLAIGNSCDFEREDEPFTQVVPLSPLSEGTTDEEIREYRTYRVVRRFYVFPFSGVEHRVADFTMPVALHKAAFENKRATICARLSDRAWYLLHACLVRFLARGDARLR